MPVPESPSFFFRARRNLKRHLRAYGAMLRHGRPGITISFNAGMGDELLATCVLRELKKRGQKRVWVLSDRPEVFRHSPDVDQVVSADFSRVSLVNRLGFRLHDLWYSVVTGNRHASPPEHILKVMLRIPGITGEVELRPFLYLSEDDRTDLLPGGEFICVQSSILGAMYPIELKEWYPDRMQRVVDELSGRFTVVQLGSSEDPLMQGALDLRGKLKLRQLAYFLSKARLFVGLEGGLMHMARAVSCRSVIVYGGRHLPWQTGYPCNENVYRQPSCSPCWLWHVSECQHAHVCMDEIQPAEVLAAVDRALRRTGPLEVETTTL